MAERQGKPTLRWVLLAAVLLVVVQASFGMVVNLYVAIPVRHLGAKPSNYFAGSFHSVVWAVSHGATFLVIHASLGLALVVFVLGAAVLAIRAGKRAVAIWSVLGGLFVIGAGFNGASFLDFNEDFSSLIMALLAFAAIGSYTAALFLLGQQPATRAITEQGARSTQTASAPDLR
jgi:hypothetical protein